MRKIMTRRLSLTSITPIFSIGVPTMNRSERPSSVEAETHLNSRDQISTAPSYLVQDVIIPGWTYLLSGLPGTGKSLMALLLAKSVASGQPFLNTFRVSQPGPVLIIDSENPASLLKDHFERMAIGDDLPIRFLHYQEVYLDNNARLDDLMGVVSREKPAMVIFDSLLRFHSQPENSPEAMKLVTRGLNKIARLAQVGPATLTIHHAAKNTGRHTISRGTTEINAGVDAEYGIKESGEIITFQSYKTRMERFDPITLKIRSANNTLDMEVISLGTHTNHVALTDVKSHLVTHIQQKGQLPNQGEFITLIKKLYPVMGRPGIVKFIQDGIILVYWREAPQRGSNNAILYESI